MSGEAKVVSILLLLFLGLILANSFKNDEVDLAYETVLRTELRLVKSDEDIEPITSGLVKPILYSEVNTLDELPPLEEKGRFINIMLPAILVARYQIKQDLERLTSLSNAQEWSALDSLFLKGLTDAYKTDNLRLLQQRLITHPNSIVLAQAAVESGWGRSRFFREANNLFGVWSFDVKESRIQAGSSRKDYQVYLRKYDNISESIKDYYKNVGRHRGYRAFVRKRAESQNVKALVPLLRAYSERGDAYTKQLLSMIKFNEFEQYDNYTIDPSYFVTSVVER